MLGLRFATPVPVAAVRWLGLSGETYPDRKRGGVFGWHHERPHIPGYLVPQECGCHADTRAVLLDMADGCRLTPWEKQVLPGAPVMPFYRWMRKEKRISCPLST